MASERQSAVYAFGDCELDLGLHELRRGGEPCPVEPQVFDFLRYLIENRDRLVDKDELNAEVWNGRIVSDAALSTCVKFARQAIGDSGKRQRYIRTVPRRGFRFVGEVEEVSGQPADAAPAPPEAEALPAPTPRRTKRPWLALAVLVVVATAAAYWLLPSAAPETPSIAVLPFLAFDGDPDQMLFADGMAEDIITDLSRLDGLLVISRNSAFAFRGVQQQDVRGMSEALGARYLLEGSVRRLDGRIRVNAQLIDGHDGTHRWAERFDATSSEIYALHDRIVQRIVDELRIVLTERQQQSLRRATTKDSEAYRLYREARAFARTAKPMDDKRALELYAMALDRDPGFAEAWAADAFTAAEVWYAGRFYVMPGREAAARTQSSANRALALDPDNTKARVALAKLHLHHRQYAQAIQLCEEVAARHPTDPFDYAALAWMYAIAGEPNAATVVLNELAEFDPTPDGRTLIIIGWAQHYMGRYAESVKTIIAARESGDELYLNWILLPLAANYAHLGEMEKAKAQAALLLEHWPGANYSYLIRQNRHLRRDEDAAQLSDGLKLAGLPKWPYGFEGRDGDRLTGAQIRELLFGTRIKGQNATGKAFEAAYGQNGGWLYRAGALTLEGQSWIEGDAECTRSDDLMTGHHFCYPIYRNPSGTAAENNEYVTIDATDVRYFSVVR